MSKQGMQSLLWVTTSEMVRSGYTSMMTALAPTHGQKSSWLKTVSEPLLLTPQRSLGLAMSIREADATTWVKPHEIIVPDISIIPADRKPASISNSLTAQQSGSVTKLLDTWRMKSALCSASTFLQLVTR